MPQSYFENLLQTKINTPPLRDDYVTRPRLIERLNSADSSQSILVKSPAGYGKTTLVVDWLRQLDVDHAWYSLGNRDNHLGQFLTYVIYSLDNLNCGVCRQILKLLHSPDPPPTQRLLDHFINDLSCLKKRTMLVIDDYHVIDNREVHDAISYLLHHHPPQLQLVLLSREDLPFAVADLQAKNQLLELDFLDLRFTTEEADNFLKNAFGIDLPWDIVKKIDSQVEGWVIGLQLAAMSYRNRENQEDFLSFFSGQDQLIQRFLFEEVISHQPDTIQDFLLQTSILDRLSSPLCNYLLDIDHSQRILERLEESNLFLIPLDNKQERYRYHHLFAEALHDHLRKTQPEQLGDLYRRASTWYERHGDVEEGIKYALKGEHFQKASVLIQSVVNQVIQEGGRRQVQRWLSAFPLSVLRADFLLWVHLITAHLGLGEFNQARKKLQRLWGNESSLADFPEQEQRLIRGFRAGFLSSIEIHTSLDAEKARSLAEEAMKLIPEEMDFGRGIGPGYYAAACFHLGLISQARTHIQNAIQLSKRHEYSRLEFLWKGYQSQIELAGGNLKEAERFMNLAYQDAKLNQVQESNVISNVILGLGRLYYEWNRLDQAERFFKIGVDIVKSAGFPDRLLWGHEYYLRYLTRTGHFQEARQELADARSILAVYYHPPSAVEYLGALETCVNMQEGKIEPAQAWAEEHDQWALEERLGPKEYIWLTLARVRLALQQPDRCIPLLERLIQEAQEDGRQRSVVKASAMLARAYIQKDVQVAAKQAILPALKFAQQHGFIRSFLDQGTEIWDLLQAISMSEGKIHSRSSDIRFEYLQGLMDAFEKEKHRFEQIGLDVGCTPTDDLLTRREGEILQLLARGFSYAAIADELTISMNTVKTHIKNIYRKLDAQNKTEAINTAHSLHIL